MGMEGELGCRPGFRLTPGPSPSGERENELHAWSVRVHTVILNEVKNLSRGRILTDVEKETWERRRGEILRVAQNDNTGKWRGFDTSWPRNNRKRSLHFGRDDEEVAGMTKKWPG
jgi:hypothetical protein